MVGYGGARQRATTMLALTCNCEDACDPVVTCDPLVTCDPVVKGPLNKPPRDRAAFDMCGGCVPIGPYRQTQERIAR